MTLLRGLLPLIVAACGAAVPAAPPALRSGTPVTASDLDRDSVVDTADLCPSDPEDVDNFEDSDGCPDPDNDADRISDLDDRCPNEPETYNVVEDDDGCPDRCRVYVTSMKHCVLGPLYFARGQLTAAYNAPLIELTASAMSQTVGEIDLVTLTGFRDRKEPRGLSRRRAAHLRTQLIELGIAPERLEIVDGGIGTGATDDHHRRVDLAISKQRVSSAEADDYECTPMGPWNIRLTDDQRKERCLPPRSP